MHHQETIARHTQAIHNSGCQIFTHTHITYAFSHTTQLDKAKTSAAVGSSSLAGSGSEVVNGTAGVSEEDEEGSDGPDWCDVEQLLDHFEKRTGRRAVYSICFY